MAVSKRLTGAADAYFADTVEVFYRIIVFEVVDTAVNQLGKMFDRSHPGLSRYINLEQVLLSGIVDAAICQQYPEFDGMTLGFAKPGTAVKTRFSVLERPQRGFRF